MMMSPMAIGMLVVPVWKRLTKAADDGNEVTDANAYRHRKENPEREKSIKKRQLLAGGRERNCGPAVITCVDMASRPRRMILQIGMGIGAPSSAANFAGRSRLSYRRALSACIACPLSATQASAEVSELPRYVAA